MNPIGLVVTITIVLTIAVLTIYFIRATTFNASESGIKLSGLKNIEIKWSEIKYVKFIEKYKYSGYRPTIRILGLAMPGYQCGRYCLANKKKAWILVKDSVLEAIFIETESDNYFLSFKEISSVVDEMSKYITVENIE